LDFQKKKKIPNSKLITMSSCDHNPRDEKILILVLDHYII
jgi:hypothetical protein